MASSTFKITALCIFVTVIMQETIAASAYRQHKAEKTKEFSRSDVVMVCEKLARANLHILLDEESFLKICSLVFNDINLTGIGESKHSNVLPSIPKRDYSGAQHRPAQIHTQKQDSKTASFESNLQRSEKCGRYTAASMVACGRHRVTGQYHSGCSTMHYPPWLAQLRVVGKRHPCVATAVTSEWFITAAGCVAGAYRPDILLSMPYFHPNATRPSFRHLTVDKVIIHKQYLANAEINVPFDVYNLALLHVKPGNDPLPYVCLNSGSAEGDFGTVQPLLYDVRNDGSWQLHLPDVKDLVRVSNVSDCQNMFPNVDIDKLVCANTIYRHDSYPVQIGAPVLCAKVAAGKVIYHLSGITSTRSGGEAHLFLNPNKHISWIKKWTGQQMGMKEMQSSQWK